MTRLVAIVGAALAAFGLSTAQAATLTVVDLWNPAEVATIPDPLPVDPSASVALPGGASWVGTAPQTRVGGLTNQYESPFRGTTFESDTPFFAVRPAGTGANADFTSSATLEFSVPAVEFGFLWGSLDTYNRIEIVTGSGSTFFTGTDIAAAAGLITDPLPGFGNYNRIALVSFSAELDPITRVIFESPFDGAPGVSNPSGIAFEFSNLTATPIPLPAAAWLLLSGLAGLGLLGRKRAAAA